MACQLTPFPFTPDARAGVGRNRIYRAETALATLLLATARAAGAAVPAGVPGDGRIEEIVVTGTRLPVVAIETSAPVTVLSDVDIERGGANSIGDVLQALPMNTGSPPNTNVNGAGDGSVRVDLRGFGAERTLVLLNGRRLPNGGLGGNDSVNLNTLPVSLVDRVEVLASGASAIYGADAVGGVVNVVTRYVDGLKVGASRTIAAEGDGEIIRGYAGAGFDAFGGAWSIGVDYTEQDGVTLDRRGYSAVPLRIVDPDGTLGPALQLATPHGRFAVPAGNDLGLEPGVYTLVNGTTGETAGDYRAFDLTVDGFNIAPYLYSQTPNERATLWLLGSQPLGERVHLFMEGLVHHRESSRIAAPTNYVGVLADPAPTLADGSSGIPADNYYNPFGVDLPCCPDGAPVSRRFVERPDRHVAEDVDLWRALIGAEGEISRWTWKVAAGEAESEATTVLTGFFAQSRFVAALGPSGPDDAGRIVCGPPDPLTGRVPAADIVVDCVPLNLFGGPGSISQDQLDYMIPRPLLNTGTNEQRIAEFVLSGPGGRVLGREAQWVLGADYRREAGSLLLDPLTHALGFAVVADTPLPGGHYDAKELFAEAQLPLLHDRPWARDMGVNLGVRWSDFSSFGENTSWQAGLHWQPAGEVFVRASYADVFRAPDLFELYEPRSIGSEFALDPCGNDPSPEEQANCAEAGVPGGAYVQTDGEFPVVSGGNSQLDAETGRSFGAGVVYAPAWAPAFSGSLDVFSLELESFIGTAAAEDLLVECAERGSREVCDTIRRARDGSVIQVAALYGNYARRETRGVDVAIDWHRGIGAGEWNGRLLTTYLARWDTQLFPGGEVFADAGLSGLPRWRASASLDWRSGGWRASYAAEYIDSYVEVVGDSPPHNVFFHEFEREVAPVLYHDVEGGFIFQAGVKLRAGITNVTDEDPPFVNDVPGNTDVALYRLLGRTYFLELGYKVR